MATAEATTSNISNLAVQPAKETVAGTRYFNKDFDELEHQLQRHRAELQGVDLQIAKIEETIDNDQKRLKSLKDEMAEKVRVRARLVTVRGAMARFIQGLQTREA